MAISATWSVIPRIMAMTSPSSNSNKFSQLSSLQFSPSHSLLRINQSQSLNFSSPLRKLTLVASKKQSFASLDELLEGTDKPVLVDFYATWCGPCQFMVPVLEQVGSSLGDKIQIVKIDTEKYPTIADKYSIQALPTFILFKDGKPFDRFEGALGADKLIERIETSLQEVKQ